MRVRAQTRVEGRITVCIRAYLLFIALEEGLEASGSAYKQSALALRKLSSCTPVSSLFCRLADLLAVACHMV